MDSFIFYTGPMFSGKTTKMISKFLEISSEHKEKKARLYFPKNDNRYTKENAIISNDKIVKQNAIRIENLADINKEIEIIGIDELHFYDDTVEYFKKLEYAAGHRIIICSGLLNDYLGNPWNNISSIIHFCTKIHFLQGTCKKCGCKSSNSFSFKSRIGVNSSNDYAPLCRKCFKAFHSIKDTSHLYTDDIGSYNITL